MEEEIKERNLQNNHDYHVKANIPLFYGTPEVDETIIPEGVIVIQKDFKELITYEQAKNKVVSHKRRRIKVFKEDDDVMIFLSKKRL